MVEPLIYKTIRLTKYCNSLYLMMFIIVFHLLILNVSLSIDITYFYSYCTNFKNVILYFYCNVVIAYDSPSVKYLV